MAFFNNTKVKTGKIPIPSTPPYIPPTPPTPDTPDDSSVRPITRGNVFNNCTLTFYQVTDENNKLNKTLGTGVTLTGGIVEDTDILNPSFVVETSTDLTQYNYCYLSSTQRYYFMHVILLTDSRYRLVMNVDVLMSYKDSVKYSYGVLSATEDERYIDNDLNDGTYINDSGNSIRIKTYANGFLDKPVNILITAGAGGTVLNSGE